MCAVLNTIFKKLNEASKRAAKIGGNSENWINKNILGYIMKQTEHRSDKGISATQKSYQYLTNEANTTPEFLVILFVHSAWSGVQSNLFQMNGCTFLLVKG